MSTFAAVTTGKGTGAIATIELFGESAPTVIKKIFIPASGKPPNLETGKILLGRLTEGSETIDQVTIGCEAKNHFAIHCHGNPIIVEMIMESLQRRGVELTTAEQLLAKTLAAQNNLNAIAIEARLTVPTARTLDGTKIVLNQIDAGLSPQADQWPRDIDALSLEQITADAARIIHDSETARLTIFGCTAAIVGPPNSGKSTLLNYLAGKQKAIVTDIKGTTRDWVSARCKIGRLSAELIDTAGLDQALTAADSTVEQVARHKTIEILDTADLILLVLDTGETAHQLSPRLLDKIAGKRILTLLNKSDLPPRFDTTNLPQTLPEPIHISAKLGTGIENLLKRIPQVLATADFDLRTPVCITARQHKLLQQLQTAASKNRARDIITELLNGPLNV
jgi:tRNA modification GTPase